MKRSRSREDEERLHTQAQGEARAGAVTDPPGEGAPRSRLPGAGIGYRDTPTGSSLSVGGTDSPPSFFSQMETKGQVSLLIQFKKDERAGHRAE